MTSKKLYQFLLIALFAVTLFSCNKESDTVTPPTTNNGGGDETNMTLLAEGNTKNNNFKVSLYANQKAFVGYNKLYFKIIDNQDQSTVTTANVGLMPMMDMGAMQHSSPYENPGNSAVNDYFEGAVVFIMPTTAGTWTVDVAVDANSKTDSVTLDIAEVVTPTEAKTMNFLSAVDGMPYFISLVEPDTPSVAIQDFEVTVHKKVTMMDFPAVTDLSVIQINPWMPTMGHGSPGNVNPTHSANGYYTGKIDFTMDGWWRVYMKLVDSNSQTVKDSAYFDMTF